MEIAATSKPGDIGVIPEGWEPATIGDVASFSGGSKPPRSTFKFTQIKGYIRLIQIRDYKTDEYASFIPEELARKRCVAEDIMIGRYGPPIFQILRGIEVAYNVAHIKTAPNEKIAREFLFYVLSQERLFQLIDSLSRRSSGQTGVEMPALRGFALPLPPVHEQRAIAKALSDVDELLGGLDRLIAKKRDLKQAAMQQLLTCRKRLPGFKGEWDVKNLDGVCLKIQDGTHFSPKLGGNDYLYVTSKNIRFGRLDMSTAERISAIEHFKIYVRCDVRKGDLLLILLGHKKTCRCRIVLWEHASPRQAHKSNASRHI